jgi:hypothetical protein
MNKNRFFNLAIIVVLIAMAALTVSQAMAASSLVSADPSASDQCSAPGVNFSSVHMVYAESTGRWMPYTDNGPTGVDGGLIQLLSARRSCSQ